MASEYTIVCYYFPGYHPDPRNDVRHGPGWTEWDLVRAAKPRFEKHAQPKVPKWGYEDESDPAAMARKIDAAADHRIDTLLFDWYWYDGPFLSGALDKGFLHAANNNRIQFALMWANHDWFDIHPAKQNAPAPLVFPGRVDAQTFDKITDTIVGTYFGHPSYWRIDGRPYFSVYEISTLIEGLGGIEATRDALERFREKAQAAGLPGLHLNGVIWGIRPPAGQTGTTTPGQVASALGLDSVTSYVWMHSLTLETFPTTDYRQILTKVLQKWRRFEREFPVTYHPNVTVGWDSSPRTVQSDRYMNTGYPYTPILSGNTPVAFQEALLQVKTFLERRPPGERIVTINAWNEWTEGSYLEPDSVHGMAYLAAIQDAFYGDETLT
jgi:hypothetical protein